MLADVPLGVATWANFGPTLVYRVRDPGHGTTWERAYRRGDMVEKRRAMMAAWGRFLRGETGAKVVEIGGEK